MGQRPTLDSNPYPHPDADKTCDVDRYENPWALWNIGWESGQPIAVEVLTATGQSQRKRP